MEWFSSVEEERTRKKVEQIPQTMKLVLDFDTVLQRIGASRREISNGTGIRFGTVNDYINGDFKNVNMDNLAHMLEYLYRNYGIEWTEIVKFVPMTPEEIEQKEKEKEQRKRKKPTGMYAKYGRYVTREMLEAEENEESEQTAN